MAKEHSPLYFVDKVHEYWAHEETGHSEQFKQNLDY